MMDANDRELFERSLRHATERATGDELDGALAEIGWSDALEIDQRAAVSLLFDLQGRATASSSALDQLLGGGADTGVVLPRLGRWRAPGTIDGDRVTIDGIGRAALAGRASALVVAEAEGSHLAVTVPLANLSVRAVGGIDPDGGWLEITGSAAVDGAAAMDWASSLRLGQLAVAHELVGASRQMLELARQHAVERIQFGVPIASFQAVRHRLAETLVAIEMAEAALDAAWIDDAPHHTAIAKALAGRGARTAARHAQQVLAGIGYTLEHPFHRYLRRTLVLDELFGSSRQLTRALGEELLRSRTLPPLLAL